MTTLADLLPVFTFAQQREKCVACRHSLIGLAQRSGVSSVTLRCDAVKHKRSCSIARSPSGACGPTAVLFQARSAA